MKLLITILALSFLFVIFGFYHRRGLGKPGCGDCPSKTRQSSCHCDPEEEEPP